MEYYKPGYRKNTKLGIVTYRATIKTPFYNEVVKIDFTTKQDARDYAIKECKYRAYQAVILSQGGGL